MIIFLAPKPECRSDPECPFHLACIQEKCKDPCQTSTCGVNAECKAKNHRAICVCIYGFVGDPYTICEERKNMYNLKAEQSWLELENCLILNLEYHILLFSGV